MADDHIAIDFEALNRHVNTLQTINDNLAPVIEAGKSTQGLASAEAFGVMCSPFGIAGTVASAAITDAATQALAALDNTIALAQRGALDFEQNEDTVSNSIDSLAGSLDATPRKTHP